MQLESYKLILPLYLQHRSIKHIFDAAILNITILVIIDWCFMTDF